MRKGLPSLEQTVQTCLMNTPERALFTPFCAKMVKQGKRDKAFLLQSEK